MHHRLTIGIASVALFVACNSSKGKPGTAANPVDRCERANDVCHYDGSQLGVCMMVGAGEPKATCTDAGSCFTCAPQH